jgi:hydantoinase/carbamoylase family amidase
MPLAKFHDLEDTTGSVTMEQELQRIGYCGPAKASHEVNRLSAHVELHIEQRRLLQDARKSIGVVTAIQGIRWYRIVVVGQRAHAGSTPMAQRADALVAAAEILLYATNRARQVSAVATVGVIELDRPSSNTVPGQVTFTLDLRHPSESVLDEFESDLQGCTKNLTMCNNKLQTQIEKIWHSPAVQLDKTVLSCIRKAADNVVGTTETMDMISLAGHDSALTALRVPTAMIFVPSKDGISHSPEEFTSEEEW